MVRAAPRRLRLSLYGVRCEHPEFVEQMRRASTIVDVNPPTPPMFGAASSSRPLLELDKSCLVGGLQHSSAYLSPQLLPATKILPRVRTTPTNRDACCNVNRDST